MDGFCAYLGLILITLLPWISLPLLQDTSSLKVDPIGIHGKTLADFTGFGAVPKSVCGLVFKTKCLIYFSSTKDLLAALCSSHLDILHTKTISWKGLQGSVLSLPPGYF